MTSLPEPDNRFVAVDASVALKWVLNEPDREQATHLLDAFEAGTIDPIAPSFLPAEVGSVLTRRYRRRMLSEQECRAAYGTFEERCPTLFETQLLMSAAFDLSLRFQLSFWDACYLALAQEFRCDLITADRRFYESARDHYPYVRMLGAG